MRWVTQIEKLDRARFVTNLDPLNNAFDIYGQYRDNKGLWINFTHKNIPLETNDNTDPVSLYETISEMYKELKDKIINYELINEKLKKMKWIEVVD